MFTQKFIKIFYSFQEIGLFSLFQNLNLGNASANPKWHLTISWATSCQYPCICKILSKYSKRFKSYRHFSRTGRRQNLHKQAASKSSQTVRWQNQMFDYSALLEIQLSVDFLRVVQFDSVHFIVDCLPWDKEMNKWQECSGSYKERKTKKQSLFGHSFQSMQQFFFFFFFLPKPEFAPIIVTSNRHFLKNAFNPPFQNTWN